MNIAIIVWISLAVGAVIGYGVAALMFAAKRGDELLDIKNDDT